MKLRTALIGSLLLASRLAIAAPTTADGWYDEGQTQYTLGNFDKAVDAFKKGFELETVDQKKPAYLYNIAQAYRQAGDCKNSVFFYKRFLALKANDTVKPLTAERKTEVDGWIHDGEACIKQQEDLRTKTPDGTVRPGDDGGRKPVDPVKPVVKPVDTTAAKPAEVVATHDDGATSVTATPDTSVTATVFAPPRVLSLRLLGGGTKISAGDLKFPSVQGTGALIAGYPIAINPKLTIEVGAAFTFTDLPFDNEMSGASESAKMFGLLANAGVRYAVAPKIGIRADVGAGVLVLSGLDEGNVFTAGGAETSGALGMFHLRVGVSADYLVTDNIAVTLTPIAFGYSPAKTGLRDDIKSITSLDFMVGLGYRM